MKKYPHHKLKVLIVEDSKIITSRIKSLLNENESFRVVGEACNRGEAMHLMEKESPDVVLLDISLPGIGGVDVLKEIKREHIHAKVIMITGHYELYYRKICRTAGADYFIDKTTEFEKIPEILISMLNLI